MYKLELIRQGDQTRFEDLIGVYRLRHKQCVQRNRWPTNPSTIRSVTGMEIDQFDSDDVFQIVHKDENGIVNGCARLMSTKSLYLLADQYAERCPGLIEGEIPRTEEIFEVSRFCADSSAPRKITGILICGIIEFGLHMGLRNIVSLSDTRIEPLIDKTGWPRKRLGKTIDTGTDISAGQIYEISQQALSNVRSYLDIDYNLIDFVQSIHNAKVA